MHIEREERGWSGERGVGGGGAEGVSTGHAGYRRKAVGVGCWELGQAEYGSTHVQVNERYDINQTVNQA